MAKENSRMFVEQLILERTENLLWISTLNRF